MYEIVANIFYVHHSRLPIIDQDLPLLCQEQTHLSQQAVVLIFKHHQVHEPLLNEEDHLMHQHPFIVIPIGKLHMILGQPLQEDENDHHLNLLVTEHVNKFA